MKKILIVIPARGGSKGIPRKNIRMFQGKPLIVNTINCSTNIDHGLYTKIIVTSDDDKILDVAREYEGDNLHLLKRPENLSQDHTPMFPVVKHALDYSKKELSFNSDLIVLLDVTSPLRRPEDVEKCIDSVSENKSDAAVTVCIPHANPYFNMVEPKGKYLRLVKQLKTRPSCRQKSPKVFWVNSAVWAIKTKTFLKEKTFLPKKTIGIEMPESRSFHIDTMYDLKLIRLITKFEDLLE